MEENRKEAMGNKLLALDIDGTLTNSQKEITPVTKSALQEIMLCGHVVILASGRPTPGMLRYERELELEKYGGFVLSYNGGRIIQCQSGEIVYEKSLPLELLPGLYGFAKSNGCGLVTYLGQDVISAFPADSYIELTARNNCMHVREVDNFPDFVDFTINKCLMTAQPEEAARLEPLLREQLGDTASVCRSDPYYIEVVPKGVDKADGLKRILQVLGRDREDLICCGDGFNDISMIQYAGVGVAMGNAQPAVKAAADYVTAANDEDGVAEVIRRFFD